MRIIAGTHRGRKIEGPGDDLTTRPITDRVKENVFNRLASLGMLESEDPQGDTPGAGWSVLDIFSGTGTLGLESLSRGAGHCVFVDQDRDAVEKLRTNLDTLGFTENTHIVQGSALSGYWTNSLVNLPVRLAFVDPPYKMVEDEAMRASVLGMVERLLPVLEEGGVVVVRTPREVALPEIEGFDGPGIAHYGTMSVYFYQSPLGDEA